MPKDQNEGTITWAGWTTFINYASMATSLCALVFAATVVIGAACGTAALITDTASTITNAVNGVQAARSGDTVSAAWDFGSAGFGFLGVGGAVRGMRAASAIEDVKNGASDAADKGIGSALNSAKNSSSFEERLEAVRSARMSAMSFDTEEGPVLDELFGSAESQSISVENQSWLASMVGISYSMQECAQGECG